MAALTSSSVWTVTPIAGIDFGAKSASTPAFKAGTRVTGTNGKSWLYAKSTTAIGSIGTCKIVTGGSATTDAGSAGWTANCPSGVNASSYFWAQRTAVN